MSQPTAAPDAAHASPAPVANGLYDPRHEHDACGVGFIAHIKGTQTHSLIDQGLKILDNLSHRGATGYDPLLDAPAEIDPKLLEELGLRVVAKPPKA